MQIGSISYQLVSCKLLFPQPIVLALFRAKLRVNTLVLLMIIHVTRILARRQFHRLTVAILQILLHSLGHILYKLILEHVDRECAPFRLL